MLTTAAPGCQTDTPMGRLAAHLPSACEGTAASAAELEMSSKCDRGIFFTLPLTFLTHKGGSVCVCVYVRLHKITLCVNVQGFMHTFISVRDLARFARP